MRTEYSAPTCDAAQRRERSGTRRRAASTGGNPSRGGYLEQCAETGRVDGRVLRGTRFLSNSRNWVPRARLHGTFVRLGRVDKRANRCYRLSGLFVGWGAYGCPRDDPFDRTVAGGAGTTRFPLGAHGPGLVVRARWELRTAPARGCDTSPPRYPASAGGTWVGPDSHRASRHHHPRHTIRPEAHLRCTGRLGRAGCAGQRANVGGLRNERGAAPLPLDGEPNCHRAGWCGAS